MFYYVSSGNKLTYFANQFFNNLANNKEKVKILS